MNLPADKPLLTARKGNVWSGTEEVCNSFYGNGVPKAPGGYLRAISAAFCESMALCDASVPTHFEG
jgi:hypothetical protein